MPPKSKFSALLHTLQYGYTQIRLFASIAIGGGAVSLVELFSSAAGVNDIFSPAGRARLWHAFAGGAVVAVVFHFLPTPVKPGTVDRAVLTAPTPTSQVPEAK